MPWNSAREKKAKKAQAKAWAFLWLFPVAIFFVIGECGTVFSAPQANPVITEELSKEEKQTIVKQLLEEGDQYVERKDYNLANASYESVFLLEPNNLEASKRIDRLKKRMLGEGRSETELVTRVYDAEIEQRAQQYLEHAKQFMAQQKWGQARFTLQKLLLISPLHEEANKLYKGLNKKLAA